MAKYKRPGVYIQETKAFPLAVEAVATAIPAFIGSTEIAVEKLDGDLHYKPKRISSVAEYIRFFGGPPPETGIKVRLDELQDSDGNTTEMQVSGRIDSPSPHIMYYAMQFYFANGGGPCYIVSTGEYSGVVTPGSTSTDSGLLKGLETLRTIDEVTLIYFPESQSISIGEYNLVHDQALRQCEALKDRFVVMDMPSRSDSATSILDDARIFRTEGIGLNNLKYGAVYAPNLETAFDYSVDDAEVTIEHFINADTSTTGTYNGTNLAALDNAKFDGVIADFLIIDNFRQAVNQIPLVLPPGAGVLGIYVVVDSSRGVWKAPANVSLSAVIRPVVDITHQDQEDLNVDVTRGKSINAIRSFIGQGVLVWGARTLAGNDNDWRYISVRRFFNMAEESIKKTIKQLVFEPNDADLWTSVRGVIEGFLQLQWREGALAGATPEDAFYVRVGLNETMTSVDILEGRMNIEIGMAVVRPAEFIILKFSQKMQTA